jgi:hypothetical protein
MSVASAQNSYDGKNRWVTIFNDSYATVITVYAVPSHHGMSYISGQDWIPNTTIRPRESYNVNFDDGRGTCYYDLRATSEVTGRDWIRRNFNVCAESTWTLVN